jgi:uncharacterized protein YkwD
MKALFLSLLLLLSGAAFAGDSLNEITAENVIRLMNEERAQAALPPLQLDSKLTLAADDRMQHMEEESYWNHESPEGLSPFTWVREREYEYLTVGENLATGFETAKVLMEGWMESPGHRANIMSPDFQDCGIAVIDGSTRGPAVGKSIVVMFGKKKDAAVKRARVQ